MTGTPWITPGKAATPYRAQSHVASTVANILSRPPSPDPKSRQIDKTVEVNYLIDADENCEVADALESLLKDDEVVENISISGYVTITGFAVPDGW